MDSIGVFVIVKNQQGEILLGKRRDWPLWDLPGGRLEAGEELEVCGVRECQEETGYLVKVTAFVGEFQRPEVADLQYLYVAEIVGGKALTSSSETRELRWFSPRHLPLLLVPHRKKQIRLYDAGLRNVAICLKEPFVIRWFQK